jgi:adenylylsulfate kinase
MVIKATNIVWHNPKVTKIDRHRVNKHTSCVLWFTGLSGAGKSTLSIALEKELFDRGIRTYILDGDNIRHGLNRDLGFSPNERKENIRRIGEVAKLFVDAGLFVMTAFISPYKEDREMVRSYFETKEFIEIHVNTPLEECERRDIKGQYQKARRVEIKDFTGISSPYEEPGSPELAIDTSKQSVEQSVKQILSYLIDNGYF